MLASSTRPVVGTVVSPPQLFLAALCRCPVEGSRTLDSRTVLKTSVKLYNDGMASALLAKTMDISTVKTYLASKTMDVLEAGRPRTVTARNIRVTIAELIIRQVTYSMTLYCV